MLKFGFENVKNLVKTMVDFGNAGKSRQNKRGLSLIRKLQKFRQTTRGFFINWSEVVEFVTMPAENCVETSKEAIEALFKEAGKIQNMFLFLELSIQPRLDR